MKYDRIFMLNALKKNNNIRIAIIVMLFVNIFYLTMDSGLHFFDMFFFIDNSTYNILALIYVLFITSTIINIYEKNYLLIMRLKDRQEYLREIIKYVVVANLIMIILNYLLLFILILIFSNGIIIEKYLYGIPNYIYMFWLLIKKIFVLELISIVFLFVFKNVVKPFSIIINVVLCSLLFIVPYYDNTVKSLSNIFIFYGDYFVFHKYISFLTELSSFLFFHSIYSFMLYIMYLISIRKIKDLI